jgi:hypothetical protein
MNGLPALAQDVASRGRNGDSMLVHMTPGEVQGLQALALAHGGSLSVNPDTGLVEANFLKRLLPAIAGAALTIGTGGAINPATAGMIVGGAETLRTGNLGRGFMAGLGAYGGAGLGAGFSAAGGATTTTPIVPGAEQAGVAGVPPGGFPSTTAATTGSNFGTAATGAENVFSSGTTGETARTAFLGQPSTATTPATGVGGYSGLAKSTLAASVPFMEQEQAAMPVPEDPYANYKGPYKPSDRAVRYPSADDRRRLGTGEFTYFTPSNPIPYAEGGEVSPAQAQVLQNIANVQNLAGLPAIDASMFGAQPAAARPAPRAGLVYNPIQNRAASAIPTGEKSHGFKAVEYADKPDLSGLDMGGGFGGFFGSVLGRAIGPNALPQPQYTFDPTSQTIRPSQAYLDAIAARRQQVADEQAAAAAATANNMGGFAYGGSVPTLEEGGFVLTKKAVDGLGGGNNKRGQQVAQKTLGAKPIRGPGTGTSDSIRTSIAGKQPALVSNGEAYVPEKKVKQNGGAKAFYELMARAEKAAKA